MQKKKKKKRETAREYKRFGMNPDFRGPEPDQRHRVRDSRRRNERRYLQEPERGGMIGSRVSKQRDS